MITILTCWRRKWRIWGVEWHPHKIPHFLPFYLFLKAINTCVKIGLPCSIKKLFVDYVDVVGKKIPSLDFYCIGLPCSKLSMFGHKLERGAFSLWPFQLMIDKAWTRVCFQFCDIENLMIFSKFFLKKVEYTLGKKLQIIANFSFKLLIIFDKKRCLLNNYFIFWIF